MNHRFPSKVDWWLAVFIGVGIATEIIVAIAFLVQPQFSFAVRGLIALGCLGIAGFMASVLLGTYYIVGERELLVRSGPFRFRVAIDEITDVKPTNMPWSSPACSLDRLLIHFRRGGRKRSIMISPKDKAGFLSQLAASSPGLAPDGAGLLRISDETLTVGH